jgi:hypothetical protein
MRLCAFATKPLPFAVAVQPLQYKPLRFNPVLRQRQTDASDRWQGALT